MLLYFSGNILLHDLYKFAYGGEASQNISPFLTRVEIVYEYVHVPSASSKDENLVHGIQF